MQNTQKTRYSDSELQEFKKVLLDKLETAKFDLNDCLVSLKIPNDSSNKLGDAATASAEKEQFSELAARQRKLIQQLEAALVRIGNKTYGICRETSRLIPKGRLMAVPHTTLCIEAKNAARDKQAA